MSAAELSPLDALADYGIAEPLPPEPGEPTFTAGHGIFTASWPEVALTFDLVRLERSGEVSAEVTVRSVAPGLERLLHRARFNLSATRSRAELAKHLASRARGLAVDWPEVLERAVLAVLEAYRAGEPAIALHDAPQPLHHGHLLDPLLLAGLPTIIFGDGGSAKSLIALAAGLTLDTGEPLLGLPAPSHRLRVGYFDWEFTAWDHRERARALLGHEDHGLVYVRCQGPLADQTDRLRRIVADEGLDYGIFDSAGFGCDGPPEASDVALRFFDGLARLELAAGSLLVAHVPKDGQTDKPFGSAYWHNSARLTWYSERQNEPGREGIAVGLFNRKANTARLAAPLAFEIGFGERIEIVRRDALEVPSVAEHLPLRVRIAHEVQTGAKTYVQLAASLDADVEAIRKAIARSQSFTRVVGPDGITRWGLRA